MWSSYTCDALCSPQLQNSVFLLLFLCNADTPFLSPLSPLSPQDPTSAAITPESSLRAKKIFLDSLPSIAIHHHNLEGFTKIQLPVSTAVFRPPASELPSLIQASCLVLCRCSSDPVSSPRTQGISSSESFLSMLSTLQSSESAVNMENSSGMTWSLVKPLYPTLHRLVSDPTTSTSRRHRREEKIKQVGWDQESSPPSPVLARLV